jgi:rhodanese-related sulfurtransferase
MKKIISSMLIATVCATSLFSATEPKSPKKQTSWKLYVDAKEAYNMKKSDPDNVLLLDVRDPAEIMVVGFSNFVDYNIPFMFINKDKWHPKMPFLGLDVNKNFEKDIAKALKMKNMDKDDAIIIMCRSGGTRGAPATKLLEGHGYKKVYVVTDGFEGSKTKSGDKKGFRLENGWKNSDLPWGYKLDKSKMYFSNFK